VISDSASLPFSSGSATAFAVRWPSATGLTSYLSGCLSLTSRRCFFDIADVLEANEACLSSDPSRCDRSLYPAFRRLWFGGFFWNPPEPFAPCWRTVATLYPLGNCDSLRLETCPSYLTRLGAVSNRSSPLSPFFAFTDDARTSPEELVNSASSILSCDFTSEGLSQPAWPNLSPVTWDYPWNLRRLSFVQLRRLRFERIVTTN
jgi:hypothetical protein